MVETMEIQIGYKKTEVGIIPSDWDVKLIGDVLKVKHGKSQKEVVDKNGVIPILGTGGLMGYSNQFLYNKPSVLIGRKGTIDKPQYMDTPFWTVDTLFYTEAFEGNLPKFLYYKFLLIDWYSYNEASGVPSLNAKTIEKIFIAVPPNKKEQTAIATALSDTDALIDSLEKLIAKKRNIKQAAMQELLKPKEGWEIKKLREIVIIKKGVQLNRETLNDDDIYPVMNGGISQSGFTNKWNTEKETIIISEGGNSCGFVNFMRTKFWKGGHCYEIITDINKYFLYQFLKFSEKSIMYLRVGSGLPNIQLNRLYDFELYIPKAIEKQKEISDVLWDMDTEISALESKLDKYRVIKQGMMQTLLTGKIRLV